MRRDSPVLAMVILLWEVFLVVSEESVELDALFEVFNSFHASNLLQEIEVAIDVNAGTDQSVPVHALDLNVSVVLLELEVNGLVEVYIGTLDSVHVLSRHFKLVEIEVLWKHLHTFLTLIFIII